MAIVSKDAKLEQTKCQITTLRAQAGQWPVAQQ